MHVNNHFLFLFQVSISKLDSSRPNAAKNEYVTLSNSEDKIETAHGSIIFKAVRPSATVISYDHYGNQDNESSHYSASTYL